MVSGSSFASGSGIRSDILGHKLTSTRHTQQRQLTHGGVTRTPSVITLTLAVPRTCLHDPFVHRKREKKEGCHHNDDDYLSLSFFSQALPALHPILSLTTRTAVHQVLHKSVGVTEGSVIEGGFQSLVKKLEEKMLFQVPGFAHTRQRVLVM